MGTKAFSSLCHLIVKISIEEPDSFAPEEVDKMIGAMRAAGIIEAARQMRRLLSDAADPAKLWWERVAPWIERYWPDAASFLGAKPAGAANRLLLGTREAFPDAVQLLVRKHLVGLLPEEAWKAAVPEIIHHDILPEHKRKPFDYAAAFPTAVVDWLARITPDALEPWHKSNLRKVLKRLSSLRACLKLSCLEHALEAHAGHE